MEHGDALFIPVHSGISTIFEPGFSFTEGTSQ
jgi:hypothetical protein